MERPDFLNEKKTRQCNFTYIFVIFQNSVFRKFCYMNSLLNIENLGFKKQKIRPKKLLVRQARLL